MEHKIRIYTDGSCKGNPGPGGWAYLLSYKQHHSLGYGTEAHTTNNRMEMRAVVEALRRVKQPIPVALHVDSEYIFHAFTKKWLKRWAANHFVRSGGQAVKNTDLWRQLLRLTENLHITWHKVPAHKDNMYNNFVDQLAQFSAAGKHNKLQTLCLSNGFTPAGPNIWTKTEAAGG